MQLREYQERAVHQLAKRLAGGTQRVVLQLATGAGKCLGKDTPVLMYNGEVKKVQDIKAGELLMGPDSRQRKVLSTCRGQEMLYKVIPVKGDPYIVNESHVLSLKRTNIKNGHRAPSQIGGVIKNISVKDYLQKSKTFKHIYKGWRTGVDFNNKYSLPIPAYLLGVWLGDGNSRGSGFATIDGEILAAITDYANKNNCRVRHEIVEGKCPMFYIVGNENRGRAGGGNSFKNGLMSLGLISNKHIPLRYKTASREDRMELLAGLIDTDGSSARCGFDFVFKNEKLAKDVVFVARSLGLSAYIKECKKTCVNNGKEGVYFRISISGDGIEVPVRISRKKPHARAQIKSHLVTGIKVEPVGVGDYYGFEIDGDRLFMLGDFTVTHNTVIFSAITERYIKKSDKNVLILVHRKELLRQARKTLGVNSTSIIAGTKHVRPSRVYIGMVESTMTRLPDNIGMVIIDECHIANFNKAIPLFPNAFIIGVTATPLSSNKRKPLNSFYQDIVCGVDIPELITGGYLAQNITYAPRDVVDRATLTMKGNDFDESKMSEQFSKAKHVLNTVNAYEKWVKYQKTIIFNVSITHNRAVNNAFILAGYNSRMIDSKMSDTERDNNLKWFSETPGAILNNVGILTAGFDEPNIEAVIFNKATTSMPLWLQCVGRAARVTPTKSIFTVIDMGANAVTHGDWCDARDWQEIFMNPPKAKDKGAGSVKVCPQCCALIAVSCKICKFCGYEYPVLEDAPDETPLSEFVLLTKNINVEKLIEKNKHRKQYYPFFKIGEELAAQAKKTIPKMTDEIAEGILDEYYKLAAAWCTQTNIKFSDWHRRRAHEHLWIELSEKYKKWDIFTIQLQPAKIDSITI